MQDEVVCLYCLMFGYGDGTSCGRGLMRFPFAPTTRIRLFPIICHCNAGGFRPGHLIARYAYTMYRMHASLCIGDERADNSQIIVGLSRSACSVWTSGLPACTHSA